jgi:uncharacterized membrane protein
MRSRVAPTTRLGWWAVWFALATLALWVAAVVKVELFGPDATLFGLAALLSALVGGSLALLAIVTRADRAVATFVALLPLALMIALVVWRSSEGG